MLVRILLILIYGLLTVGCIKQATQNLKSDVFTSIVTSGEKIIIQGHYLVDSVVSFNKEVIIMPQAFIRTKDRGEIRFEKKVTVIGSSHVFDVNSLILFGDKSISELNPSWFGANGTDDEDDTEAFVTVLNHAKNLRSSVNVVIPIGRFIITEQLRIENNNRNEKAINLIGTSLSGNTIKGSCLQWHGSSDEVMMVIRNTSPATIQHIEFTCYSTTNLKHNVKLEPYMNQFSFRNCSFAGCSGEGAANVNINSGNNAQVSEISFDNCIFRSFTTDNINWQTASAVIGGLANTKNFYFNQCSFLGYTTSALRIGFTSVLKVNDCTFSNNDIDIQCDLCNALITSNYSEQSRSFFKSGPSRNMSFTTLMNNYFDGHAEEDYFIRDGSGSLVLINNSFGGTGHTDDYNKINWSQNEVSSITSISNYYRNDKEDISPFFFEKNNIETGRIFSVNDLMGVSIFDLRRLNNNEH